MKNFRCHDQQERVVDVDPHRASTSSVRPVEQPTSPAKDVLPERSDLQFLYPTDRSPRRRRWCSIFWYQWSWKRIGLTGHPIAVVKVAITSKVHGNKNSMQRTSLTVVRGHANICIYLEEISVSLQYRNDRIYDGDNLIRFQTAIRCA